MEGDIEDIKKLDAIIKEENNTVTDEFDEFINYTISDDEEQLECIDEEELVHIEDAIDTMVDSSEKKLYHNVETLNFSDDLNLVKRFLSLEEVKVINSCKDVKLKELLILNRAKHIQLQNIRYRLYELLKQCKISLRTLEDKIEIFKNLDIHMLKSIMPKLGHPYFKTKDFYSCSPNADTLRKQKSKEISIEYLPQLARWTLEDQVILKRAIIFNYTNDIVDKCELELKNLKFAKKKSETNTLTGIEKGILDLEEKLAKLKGNQNPEPPPLDSNIEINWINISKCDFASRHSPHACKAFWNIYLHPSINKAYWTDKENKKIQELVKIYNYQNWEEIAIQLNNNRSGFAVCVHYYTTLSERFKKSRFDLEEDQFLLDVVNVCRIGNYIPWSKVSHYFQNRSRAQLYHRYKYNLEYTSIKKGAFSSAEDIMIALLVRKFGKDFSRCCRYIPNRSPCQVAHRYNNYLCFDKMDLGCWSLKEDEVIMNHVAENGEKAWSKLFSAFPTKNRTHIRNRYIYLKDWLLKNAGKKLIDIPRRTKGRKYFDEKQLVNNCIAHFNNLSEIPTLLEINEYLNSLGQLSNRTVSRPVRYRIANDNIDKELVQYFQSTCKIKTSKSISGKEIEYIADIVTILMSVLGVDFTIPSDVSLHSIPKLDALDVEILSLVFSDNTFSNKHNCDRATLLSSSSSNFNPNAATRSTKVDRSEAQLTRFCESDISYLPPNINTLVGIRSLLVMHLSYRSKHLGRSQLDKIISSNMPSPSTKSGQKQKRVLSDQEKYSNRFNTIFKWPALMSVMEPNESLIVSRAKKEVTNPRKPQKIGRPRKNLIKIELMNKARMKKYLNVKTLNQPTNNNAAQQELQTSQEMVEIDDPPTNRRLQKSLSGPGTKAASKTNFKASNQTKRTTEINMRNAKKLKTDCDNDNHSNEEIQLQNDIEKLNNLLKLEFKQEL